jgi:DNA repair photolyase
MWDRKIMALNQQQTANARPAARPAAKVPASPKDPLLARSLNGRARGRGTLTNQSGRFEPYSKTPIDDGWNNEPQESVLKTSVQEEKSRTIITRNDSPDLPFDRSINPYRGCEHGCTYCFARPTHAYMGLSAGLDFETKLFAKPDAVEQLKRELSAPTYKPRPIAIGTNTDPYQPIERNYRLMRGVLEVLIETGHPVSIVTKSSLVLRDLDLLKQLAERDLVKVAISVTTLDRKLCAAMEPRAAAPQKRLEVIEQLSNAGIPTAVLMAPIIPALNDIELEAILEACFEAGAVEASTILLRLPREVADLFQEWLLHHFPDRYRHVTNVLRSMHGGRLYDSTPGKRMKGQGPYADMIQKRLEVAIKRLGLSKRKLRLSTDHFVAPQPQEQQLSLF